MHVQGRHKLLFELLCACTRAVRASGGLYYLRQDNRVGARRRTPARLASSLACLDAQRLKLYEWRAGAGGVKQQADDVASILLDNSRLPCAYVANSAHALRVASLADVGQLGTSLCLPRTAARRIRALLIIQRWTPSARCSLVRSWSRTASCSVRALLRSLLWRG